MSERNQNKDLVLAPGEYAYVQEMTKGIIQVLVGPTTFAPTAQHKAVVFSVKGEKPFEEVLELRDAVKKSPIAVEGMYLQLLNPTKKGIEGQPEQGHHSSTPELCVGRKVNIPGPVMFSLWPGQSAQLIKGHTLRSNQYLLVRVYNDEEAKKNWSKAVVKKATDDDSGTKTVVADDAPKDISVGKQYIIKGTEVSFYIPPTGITVVPDENGSFVREAVTLEKLEYCILVSEEGFKRYEKGPAVVFPFPNEKFISIFENKISRAYELNINQGIHVKVISDYEDGDKKYKTGEELFITGKDAPIYFPREEHSVIEHSVNKIKHEAFAVPVGEGLYVMNKETGVISTISGPSMALADPRTEIFIKRKLTNKECMLWYPDNKIALEYNRSLTTQMNNGSYSEYEQKEKRQFRNSSKSDSSTKQVVFDTKYQGVPVVYPYTGYAVQVISATGERKVVVGPKKILMGFSQTLETLKLSTGKPKTTDELLETVYLRVKNNKISDVICVETLDHVKVEFKISMLGNFIGDSSKWFEVENYVKLLCDSIRTTLSSAAKKIKISDLYSNAVDFVLETILKKQNEDEVKKGFLLQQCNFLVENVDVLSVKIYDQEIEAILNSEQRSVVEDNIFLEKEKRNLALKKEKCLIKRQVLEEDFEIEKYSNKLKVERMAFNFDNVLREVQNEMVKYQETLKSVQAKLAIKEFEETYELNYFKTKKQQEYEFELKKQQLRIEEKMANAEAILKQTEKFMPEFAASLTTLSSNQTLQQIADSLSVQNIIGGKSITDVFSQIFANFPGLESFLEKKGFSKMLKK